MDNFKNAKDIAINKLIYIDGLDSAKNAARLMRENGVKALIINKRNSGDAHGFLTIGDIIRGVIIPNKSLDEVSVYEIMTKPVFSIPASLNAKYVPRLMENYNIRIAPVEENGEYVGLIDFAQCLFNALE